MDHDHHILQNLVDLDLFSKKDIPIQHQGLNFDKRILFREFFFQTTYSKLVNIFFLNKQAQTEF